jgi:hypothetical protein
MSTSFASHGVPGESPDGAHSGGGGGALQSTTPPSVLSIPTTVKAPSTSPHWNARLHEVSILMVCFRHQSSVTLRVVQDGKMPLELETSMMSPCWRFAFGVTVMLGL